MAETVIRRTVGKGGNYRPTKQGAGMTKKGIAAYRRANPKSKLKGAYQKATKGAGAGMPGDDALTRHSPGTKIKIK